MIGNGWIDWATKVPGHPKKVYSQSNSGEWITCHSIVGDLPSHSIPPRFQSDEHDSAGNFTPAAAASVMFILYRDGSLVQMYPVTASTWTSGGPAANTRSWAIEAEGGAASSPGGYGEPLTPAAVATFARLMREWKAYKGVARILPEHMRQHKDVAKQFGYPATACASDRYAEAWARVLLEDGVIEEELSMSAREDILLGMFAGSEQHGTREERLAYAEGRLAAIVLGAAPSLIESGAANPVGAGSAGGVPEHRHAIESVTLGGVIR